MVLLKAVRRPGSELFFPSTTLSAGALLLIGASAIGAVAILTEFWSSTYDSSGAHIGLYKRCWPESAGGPLACEQLEWWSFTQMLLKSDPTMPFHEASDRWPLMLTTRYCMIGATAGCFAVALLTIVGIAARTLMPKRVLYTIAASVNLLCVLALAAALICWSQINKVVSNYRYADFKLGYSWTLGAASGGLAIVASILLVAHGMCLCFCPGACCSRRVDGLEDEDASTELPMYRRGNVFREEDAYDEKWWQSAAANDRKQRGASKYSGTAGSAASSASSTGSSTVRVVTARSTGGSSVRPPNPEAVRAFAE